MEYRYITDDIRENITETVHKIHRNPELSHKEFLTTALIKETLENMDIEFPESQPKTGVLGLLCGKNPGPTVAIRADIDALPIDEVPEHEIRSGNPGIMHACGHDFHTTSLLGAAKALCGMRDNFSGNILFIFQPAEEKGSGAKEVISTGIFEKFPPDAFLSLHVKPDIPEGKIGIRKGPIMAAMCTFCIRIIGKGGHGATPHLATDPIIAAVHAVDALQCIRSRRTDPAEPFTLSICTIHGGSACNIIPDDVYFEGTFRCAQNSLKDSVKKQIIEICESVAKAHGCAAECSFINEAPPLVNDEKLAGIAYEAASGMFGEENVLVQNFWMASEDFSYYREFAPIFMYHVGVGKEDGSSPSLHNPGFFAPDKTAPLCAELLAGTALAALEKLR
ncbi:MAG: amidohydrolase [Oscillospiraceae bacterium]|nr:amidohydrolase [Oscillospiraceae bacterium]